MTSAHASRPTRKLLVIADETPECRVALRYAARRAQHTDGRLSLLYVMEPAAGQEWMALEERMRAEAREEAERLLYELAEFAHTTAGLMPELIIAEGETKEEVLAFIRGEPDLRLLVLGAGTGRDGPGPLVTTIAGDIAAHYTIPVTIVPGGLTADAIDALA